jgi:hypothetical protein
VKKTITVMSLAVLILFLTSMTSALWGQSVGSLQGQVIDATGAAIVKATVEATDLSNNTAQSTERVLPSFDQVAIE